MYGVHLRRAGRQVVTASATCRWLLSSDRSSPLPPCVRASMKVWGGRGSRTSILIRICWGVPVPFPDFHHIYGVGCALGFWASKGRMAGPGLFFSLMSILGLYISCNNIHTIYYRVCIFGPSTKKKLGYTDASTVDPPLRNSQILTHDHGEIVYTNKNKQFHEQNKLLWKRTGILEPTYVPFQQPFARAKPNGTNTSKH